MLQAPYTMRDNPATTVGYHGNNHQFGKASTRKADNCFVVCGALSAMRGWIKAASRRKKKSAFFTLACPPDVGMRTGGDIGE